MTFGYKMAALTTVFSQFFIVKPIFNNYNQKSGIKKGTINQHKTTEKQTNKQTTAATTTAPTKAVSISSIPFLLTGSVNLLRLGPL